MRRRDFVALALAGGAAWYAEARSGSAAWAQGFPTRTIKLVVPFPPGGPTDTFARLIADRLAASLKQPTIVEHRPGGAGGTVGAKAVAASEPDGHTLLVALVGTLTIAPAIYRDSGYEPTKNFAPVALLSSGPQVLVLNPAVPAKSLSELVAYARANPKKVSAASPGYGTQPHLLAELFRLSTGADILHVPYRGSAPAVTDLLAGQVQMMFDVSSTLLPHIAAGRLRAIAVTTAARDRFLPEVPTVIEGGVPQLEATVWSSIVAPAGTPAPVVARLNAAINEALHSPEMKASLERLGFEPKTMSPPQLSAFIAAETRKWAAVVEQAGIKR